MIAIERVTGLCTIQDLGRRGHMHEAVPHGGALVAEWLVAANRAARNPDNAPALELLGELVLRAERDVELDRGPLLAGQTIKITSAPARVTYIAVRSGLDAPLVLDGRGTLLFAGLGRALRAGDRLSAGGFPLSDAEQHRSDRKPKAESRKPIVLIPGPDLDAFDPAALATFCADTYAISPTSDRVGTRLVGAPVRWRAEARARSRPLVRGAIEIPPDGAPIVLGVEHPTCGGYPVLAVVASADLGSLHAIPLGGRVRFAIAPGTVSG